MPTSARMLRRMPKRTDIDSILIIGAGPIVIGQACEFDYSGRAGVQGAEGRGLPDRAGQFEPGDDHDRSGAGRRDLYRADHAGDRRARSSPASANGHPIGALLPTMGGQTALNTAMALARSGALAAPRRRADRRQRGGDRQGRGPPAVPPGDGQDRPRIAEEPARHARSTRRVEALDHVGLPAIIRPSFTLGRHRRRHRLQHRGIRGDRPRRPAGLADARGAGRGIGARLEGIRDGGRPRPRRQLHHRLLDRERRSDGRPHRRFGDASRRR